MVSKEFFGFISAHCGNVVAWLLILWPFVHLALLIRTFSRTIFDEVISLLADDWEYSWHTEITAMKITCIKLYNRILIFSALSIIYFGLKIGIALFIFTCAVFLIHMIDIGNKENFIQEAIPEIIKTIIYLTVFVIGMYYLSNNFNLSVFLSNLSLLFS